MDFLLEFAEFFFWFMLSYMACQVVFGIFLYWLAGQLEKRQPKTVTKQDNSDVLARLEVVENQFFLYNNETNQFLGQGSTVHKLKDHVVSRFPNRNITIVAGKKSECELIKRELEHLNANRNNV